MTPEAVFAELGGLRALARSLVHGDADADDLLQDAALAALEHPPVIDERPVGGWLRAIIRNRWRMDRRGASRRHAREQTAASVPDGDDVTQAIDRARELERLAGALVALDEPFRTVVVRRFLDGQSAAQIAVALAIPAGTVRWRLKTGLTRLRAALDGERPAGSHAEPARPVRWQRMLAPLIGVSVKAKATVVAILLLLLLGVIALWMLHRAPPPPPVITAHAAPPTPPHPPAPPPIATPAARVVHAERPTVEPSTAPGGVLTGRVVHGLTRDGVAGAEVTFLGSTGATTLLTGDDGGFVLAPPGPGRFVLASVAAPGFLPYASPSEVAPVRATLAQGHDVRGIALILWPAIDYQGEVIDARGAPAPGARVRLIGTLLGQRPPEGAVSEWTADDDGRFTFQAAPWALLEATRGTGAGRVSLTPLLAARKQLTIQLRDDGWLTASIIGHVRTADGSPIDDAQVTATPDPPNMSQATVAATTGDDGGFTLGALDRGAYQLAVEAPGYARATIGRVLGGSKDVTITVDPGVALAGRVVDPTGAPVPVFNLTLTQPGRPRDIVVARSIVDPDGRFALRVAKADYELWTSAAGWAPARAIAIAAGTSDVTITLQVGSTVRGFVIASDSGAPIAHARVRRAGVGGGSSVQPLNPGAVTARDGSFELTGIPAGPVMLSVEADGFHPRVEATTSAIDGGALGPIRFALTRVADGELLTMERVGIGVALDYDDGYPRVVDFKQGSSAQAAGVQLGDHIAAVDGLSVFELNLRSVIDKITGPSGTSVALSILRDGRTTELVIQRRAYRVGM